MGRLKIGIAQINPTVGDFEGNLKKILAKIHEAECAHLDLVVFPELVISGYPVWDLANKESFIQAGLASLRAIAQFTRKQQVAVMVGFIDQGPTAKKSYNALAVIQKGRILHRQYKTLLPTYDVFLEQIFFESGKAQGIFSLKGIKVAASICEDIWDDSYPVKPIKEAKKKGAELLINISASPFFSHAAEARDHLITRKAKQYGLAIIYANQIGGQDDLVFDGRSLAADARGAIFMRAPAFLEGLFACDWAPGDRKSPVPRKPFRDPAADIYKALVIGLRDYVRKNRFSKVAIGLSGGIDSALVAALAHDALGSEAVLGVMMPGPFSSKGSVEDAKRLGKNLGIALRMIPITPIYRHHIRTKGVRGKISPAEENLQARLRGIELMYLSNKEGYLLLTTGNKSEMAMGYATLYGDMCGGLGVIGDVYKTEVYRLARYRNSVTPVIPHSTLVKPPSAELRPHQKDSDSLPPYALLDEILYQYIEKNRTLLDLTRIFKRRASRGLISRIIRTVDHNEYKRRQAPPILRVTEKAWFGRRMPITNRFLGTGKS